MTDLVKFLHARCDADEWWARAASRVDDNPVPGAGHHWRWTDDHDQVIDPDLSVSEVLLDAEGYATRANLCSDEEYPHQLGVMSREVVQSGDGWGVADC